MSRSILKSRRPRERSGFTTVALVLVLAFFVALPLGLLGFELARYSLMQQQLQALADSAALAGTVQLANSNYNNSGSSGYANMIAQAENAAYATFTCSDSSGNASPNVQNSILQTTITTSNFTNNGDSSVNTSQPAAHKGCLNFYLYDVTGAPTGTGAGSTPTAVIQVQAIYSDSPIFASSLLPILKVETATANAYAGLPEIDVVLCFDCSSSMDDSTPVKLIERYWNATSKAVEYDTVSPNSLTTDANNVSHPNIYDLAAPGPNGVALNVQPPQNLSAVQFPQTSVTSAAGNNNFYFSEAGGPAVLVNSTYFSNPPKASAMPGLRASPLVAYTPGILTSQVNASISATTTTYAQAVSDLGGNTISGLTEQGMPPGNYDPTSPGSWTGHTGVSPANPYGSAASPPKPVLGSTGTVYGFTDMIPFLSYPTNAVNGFTFHSDADMVEASRGNLESSTLAHLAMPDTVALGTNGPSNVIVNGSKVGIQTSIAAGAYMAYWDLVRQNTHPMSDALVAAGNFFTTMNTISNAHFALVTFADNVGTSHTSTHAPPSSFYPNTYSNIDAKYWPAGGTSAIFDSTNWTPNTGWPMPYFALNSTDTPANSNYPGVLDPLTGNENVPSSNNFPVTPLTVGPTGPTNFKIPLQSALTELTTNVRPHAQKTVIVLFTDGIPDNPSGGSLFYGSDTVATSCQSAGIPIYTIGFSQNPAVQGSSPSTNGGWCELNILGDGNNGSGQGLAYKAGNGGAYFPVVNKTQLEQAFNQIASSLVTLQYQK